MNGPNLAKLTGSSAPGKEEPAANGHGEGDANPFADYMWMENEEEYNRQVEEELLEQEFLERCFQEMLDEEDQDWFIPSRDLPSGVGPLQQQLNGLTVNDNNNADEIAVSGQCRAIRGACSPLLSFSRNAPCSPAPVLLFNVLPMCIHYFVGFMLLFKFPTCVRTSLLFAAKFLEAFTSVEPINRT
ncbi:UNVERIFIED_CONTAM: hypothetical protein FKN15_037758 [Acipenser sinensis]